MERCKHGMLEGTCAICLNVIDLKKKYLLFLKEQKKQKAKAEEKARKEEVKRLKEIRMQHMIMKADIFLGDLIYEYAVQECGEDGGEKFSSGDWAPEDYMIEECMHEALNCKYPNLSYEFHDELFNYWKNEA